MDGMDPTLPTPHVEVDVSAASVELQDLTRDLTLALRKDD
jgi:hypothetical protein